MNAINIRHLRAFLAVAEYRHFTKAAQSINLTQPALSILIKQLEEELDVNLVHRRTRSVELTPIGREFRALAIKMLATFDDAMTQIKEYSDLKKGTVTLAALPSLTASVLPEIIADFRQKNPNITVRVIDAPGTEIVEALRSRSADLAISLQRPADDISETPVFRDTLVLVGKPANTPARENSIRWSRLAGEPLIVMAPGTTIRTLTDAAAASAKVSLNIVLEPRLMPTAIGFANEGYGCAVLPSSQLQSSLVTDLPQFRLIGPSVEREISLMHLSHYSLSPAASALFTHLKTELPIRVQEH